MTTTHILGDNVPRKSNFDPDLARKVAKYYEEHPEELVDKPEVPPIPTDVAKQPVGKYILMPQADTYVLGLHALQEACIKENNPNHPQFTLPDKSMIYRPLTFKETIQARVENYETHNPNGSERTIEERLSLITERWNDSCTAIAYKAGTTKFKIVPISEHLIALNPNFKEAFVRADYNTIVGTELDSSKRTNNALMSKDSVLTHAGWLAAVEGDEALLKSYANIIFTELKKKYSSTEGMGFWVRQNAPTDELRALLVNYLYFISDAVGYDVLSYGSSFLRRSPPLEASRKK